MKLNKLRSWKRIAALAIAAAVAVSPMSTAMAFGATLGNQYISKSIQTTWETQLSNNVFYSAGLKDNITENYVTYSPGGKVKPVVAYGNDIYGAASFKTVVSYAEAAGQHVIAGINADYFTMANGVADGITIQNGIIKTSESSRNTSIAFHADGSATIGRSNLNIKVAAQSFPNSVGNVHLNKVVSASSGVMLYTDAFNDTNKATIPTINALVSISDGQPTINGTMRGVVESINNATGATPIPEGKALLTIAANSAYPTTLAQFKELKAGDEISFTFNADESWNDVTYAVGAGEKLVTKGYSVAPASTSREPRTALGVKDDGSVILYTVDGRQTGYSKGATFGETAGRMIELGCVEAVNLDGGGSTAMLALYPGDSAISTINKPSGGTLRNCANYILLVSEGGSTGSLAGLHLYPFSQYLLAGAKMQMTVKATDTGYFPTSVPGDLTYTGDSLGSIDESGMFTAGFTPGTAKVQVSGGGASGYGNVNIVDNPDTIAITNGKTGEKIASSISVPIDGSFQFSGSAVKNNINLVTSGESFKWSVSGNIGTIDESGLFTPTGATSSSGTITATVGGKTASVAVNVVSQGDQVENFESSAPAFNLGEFSGITSSLEKDLLLVHNGEQSMKLAYNGAAGAVLSVPGTAEFHKTPSMMNFWLYGDNSGNTLSFNVKTESGTQASSEVKVDFSGWKQVTVNLPAGATGIAGVDLKLSGKTSGVLYMDQLMIGYGYFIDNQAPAVTASVSGQTLTATVVDEVDSKLTSDNIEVTYDGTVQTFSYDAGTKKLTATLPASDGKTHRVSVKAVDASGNVKRASVTVAASGLTDPFADMEDHWASLYTSYLFSQDIISGRVQEDSSRKYFPDLNMNRAEFSSVMVQWLGIDVNQYSGVALPFADAASIPEWAVPAVKAVYANGLMSGRGNPDGKTYFSPGGYITRQEVMTVIGHTQERGYAEANLASQFTDSGAVSSWAMPYVKSLVGQGVISGSNGRISPNDYVTRAQVASIIFGLN